MTSDDADVHTTPPYRTLIASHNPTHYVAFEDAEGVLIARDLLHDRTFPAIDCAFGQPGVDGNAAGFNGTTSAVALGPIAKSAASAISFEAWVKPNGVPPGGGWNLLSLADLSGGFLLYLRADGVYAKRSTSEQRQAKMTGLFPTDRFTHVVFTYDGANLRIYVDGKFKDATADDLDMPPEVLQLRIGAPATGSSFDGKLDEVAVYDTVLSDQAVKDHYLAGSLQP